MNRRYFLRSLIGTCIVAAVPPSIFIPKIEPVIWKFPRLDKVGFSDDIVNSYSELVRNYPAARAKVWSDIALHAADRSDYFLHFENFSPLWSGK